jgi:hypothetical protein
MKNYVRMMLCLTVLTSTLVVGSDKVAAKTAIIERQGDHVRVSYRYQDGYRLKERVPPGRRDVHVSHPNFHYMPYSSWYGFPAGTFGPSYGYYPYYGYYYGVYAW